jgi:hypothetical protein
MTRFERQSRQLREALEANRRKARDGAMEFVTQSCAKIEATAKHLMRDTETNPDVTYGKRHHHPSIPGSAPDVTYGKRHHHPSIPGSAPDVTYGKRHHHPSIPGSAPAPDSGELMRSITHDVSSKDGQSIGHVGSIINNPPYPVYLEYGTTKMKPRPWLSASIIQCHSWMSNLFKELFEK